MIVFMAMRMLMRHGITHFSARNVSGISLSSTLAETGLLQKLVGSDAMSHDQKSYEDILRTAGHRVTRQRILILDAVCEGNSHSTLGEIFARVRVKDYSIDRSTLYRTLKLYVDLGLVLSAEPGDGETYYEIAGPHRHHHLICRRCRKEQEIEHNVVKLMFDQLTEVYAFSADSDHLVIMGMCQACRITSSGIQRSSPEFR
ncbi:MAG: transcriptional repressor [Chloroflexi bacterium]|nr:transcriptional repressor [Chloroflexota bacterium]